MSFSPNYLADLAARFRTARELVVFTGAGMSRPSGIATFRDGATGRWDTVDPHEVASVGAFARRPERVWAWHADLKREVDGKRPNDGHRALAELERRFAGERFTVITQNIDGFHQAAGSSSVLELHGSIHHLRCHAACGFRTPWGSSERPDHQCPRCSAPLRPDVVWFGEPLDPHVFGAAEVASFHAELFFAVGTSALVQPAAGLPFKARVSGATLVEVNPHETPLSQRVDWSIPASADGFFVALLDAIDAG